MFSAQKKNSNGSYTGTWYVTMGGDMVCNGSVDVSGALSVEGKTKFDADVQFYKKYMILPDMKSLMLHLVVTAL